MTLIVSVDLPDLTEICAVLGLDAVPRTLDSGAWRNQSAPEAALTVFDLLADDWSADEAVVVVRMPGRDDVELVLGALAAVVGREHVVDLPLGRTPLSAAYTVAVVAPVVDDLGLPVGLIPGVMREVETRIELTALLSGVSSLSTPHPSIAMQLRGYWPGTRFLVRRDDVDTVTLLTGRSSPADIAAQLAVADARVVVAVGAAPKSWMDQVVERRQHRAMLPVAVLAADAATAEHWGTKRVVETAGLPPTWQQDVAELAQDLASRTCAWCGQPVTSTPGSGPQRCDLCAYLTAEATGPADPADPADQADPTEAAVLAAAPAAVAAPTSAPVTPGRRSSRLRTQGSSTTDEAIPADRPRTDRPRTRRERAGHSRSH